MTAPTTSYHLRPRSGWLNDPNGMARVDDVWHVFFQHNPDAPVHDRIAKKYFSRNHWLSSFSIRSLRDRKSVV